MDVSIRREDDALLRKDSLILQCFERSINMNGST